MNRTDKTNQGMSRCVNQPQGSCVNGTYPPDGKSWILYANAHRQSAPSRKTGVETPISARTVRLVSVNFPALTALITPKRIPKPSQITPAPIAHEMVAGRSRL